MNNDDLFNLPGFEPKKYYMCRLCRSRYSAFESLMSHSASDHRGRPYKCPEYVDYPECTETTFTTREELENHVWTVHPASLGGRIERYQCKICLQMYNYNEYLQEHKVVHKLEEWRINRCLVCGKKFKNRAEIKEHESLVHYMVRDVYHCVYCDQYYRGNKDLLRHFCSKESIQQYTCERCGYSFSRSSSFIEHIINECGSRNGRSLKINIKTKDINKARIEFHRKSVDSWPN